MLPNIYPSVQWPYMTNTLCSAIIFEESQKAIFGYLLPLITQVTDSNIKKWRERSLDVPLGNISYCESLLWKLKAEVVDASKHPAVFLDFVASPFSESEQSSKLRTWGRRTIDWGRRLVTYYHTMTFWNVPPFENHFLRAQMWTISLDSFFCTFLSL